MKQRIYVTVLCICLAAAVCLGLFLQRREPAPAGKISLPEEEPKEQQAVSSDGWLTLADAGRAAGQSFGVYEPMWFAYGTHLCRAVDYDFTAQTRVRPMGTVHFNKDYSYTAYGVEQDAELVAIFINGRFAAYRKLIPVEFAVNGMACELLYSPVLGTDYDLGAKILETEGYDVYEAVHLLPAAREKQYILDATRLLKTALPDMFGSCAVFREFYWVARGAEGEAQDSPVATGEMVPVAGIWGGSYIDETGKTVALLTQDTEENRQKVFACNPSLNEVNTRFQKADYTLWYLQKVLLDISACMEAGELPAVVSASVNIPWNRVVVSMTGIDGALEAKLRSFDPQGGALEFAVATHPVKDLLMIN